MIMIIVSQYEYDAACSVASDEAPGIVGDYYAYHRG